LLGFAEKMYGDERRSYTIEELAKLWSKNLDETKKILRKLRREGFVRRTRSGRYKLTLAGETLVKLLKMVKERRAEV